MRRWCGSWTLAIASVVNGFAAISQAKILVRPVPDTSGALIAMPGALMASIAARGQIGGLGDPARSLAPIAASITILAAKSPRRLRNGVAGRV